MTNGLFANCSWPSNWRGKIDVGLRTLERLLCLSPTLDKLVLDCINALARSTGGANEIGMYPDRVKAFLERCMHSGDTLLKEKANGLAGFLVSCGFYEFKDLQ